LPHRCPVNAPNQWCRRAAYAVDLDFVVAEYNFGVPVALVEYKHYRARLPDFEQATYRALCRLADGYKCVGIPFLVAFYWPDVWAFRVLPINAQAAQHFSPLRIMTERQFVAQLYHLRHMAVSKELEGKLSDELPPPVAKHIGTIGGNA
jgi:hypothetical protein